MLRKFRNLDKIANLEKRMEEYQATIGILVQQRQNRDAVIEDLEEQREQYFGDIDLAKAEIYDLQTQVKNKEKKLKWIYNKYYTYVQNAVDERHVAQKKIYRLRLQRRREQRLLAEETKKRRKAENLVKRLRKNVVERNWKIIDLERLLDIQFKNTVRLEKEWKELKTENEELKKQNRIAYGKLEDSESHSWSNCSKLMDVEDELEEAYERAILAENLHDKLKSENEELKQKNKQLEKRNDDLILDNLGYCYEIEDLEELLEELK